MFRTRESSDNGSPSTPSPFTAPQAALALAPPGRESANLELLASVAVTVVWVAVVLAAPHIQVSLSVRHIALFVHLASLVVGFGAVLAVDWLGLCWVLRRVDMAMVVRVAGRVHVMIWLGLAGLVASGALLEPNTSAPLTRVKLAAVLVVALNGLQVGRLQRRLVDDKPPSRALLAVGAAASALSQLGWWTATVVGFLATLRS